MGEDHLVTATNYEDVVAVALAFADTTATDEEVLRGIMRALRGMTNPARLRETIKKQRGYRFIR